MDCSENYLAFVKEQKEKAEKIGKEFKPYTRNQWRFAEFLFNHSDEIGIVGDTNSVFSNVSYFIKHSKNFKRK